MFGENVMLLERSEILKQGRGGIGIERVIVPSSEPPEGALSPGGELLRVGLDRLAPAHMDDALVDEVLQRHVEFHRWRRGSRMTRELGRVSTLERATDRVKEVPAVIERSRSRGVYVRDESLLVATRQICAADLRDILDFERAVDDPQSAPILRNEQALGLMYTFSAFFGYNHHAPHRETKASPDDAFTIAQRAILGLYTHANSLNEMSDLLGVYISTLSRLISPIVKAYGLTTQGDVMLFSLATGASVEHTPHGTTEVLEEDRLAFFRQYFSFDPTERTAARSIPEGTIGSHFRRAAKRIGAIGVKDLVRRLVRDEELEVPEPEAFKALAQQSL
jgi:hypothetical protein